jgi:DNA-binding response OmpR family regulator
MNDTKILIVEDSPTQAEQLIYILEKNDYQVLSAGNGKEALELLQNNEISIIISDVIMPEMDGYELCWQIKSNEKFKRIPVILLTHLSDSKDVLKGLECGADNFITKPYDENYLCSRIRYLLANFMLNDGVKIKMGVEIIFEGQRYFITSERQQILNLLISTYETAIQKNRELAKVQDQLKKLNDFLEKNIEERTSALKEEIAQRKQAEEEIKKRCHELEEFYEMSIGRELKMVELKKEIDSLKEELAGYKK